MHRLAVSRVLCGKLQNNLLTIIYLGPQLLTASSDLPESNGEPSRLAARKRASLLFDLASSGVYQAKQVTLLAGELLPHRFTLTTRRERPFGGMLSAALSLTLRLVGVTDRSALRSPDFPLLIPQQRSSGQPMHPIL